MEEQKVTKFVRIIDSEKDWITMEIKEEEEEEEEEEQQQQLCMCMHVWVSSRLRESSL